MRADSKRNLLVWLQTVARDAGEQVERATSADERERLRAIERAALRAIEMVARGDAA